MVSKRQKEAKKKYKIENPELFPKVEPTPPKDPSKKKKRTKPQNFKRKKTENGEDSSKPRFRKQLLRVPGLKPGDCCFICKDLHHIAKNCPDKALWERNKICLFCRQRGHSLQRCPNKGEEVVEDKLCYNCGETGHSLSRCPQPLQNGGTKFALCFICNERGHLSKDCPKNTHGIYPKGGSCKICGGVTHLARDCPNKGSIGFGATIRGATQDVLRPRVTKLYSGDDLEDDFTVEDDFIVKDETKKPKPDLVNPSHNKGKKKNQEPKVITFVG